MGQIFLEDFLEELAPELDLEGPVETEWEETMCTTTLKIHIDRVERVKLTWCTWSIE